MISAAHISTQDSKTIYDLHAKFNHQKNINGGTVAGAGFLGTGALIVIFCSCLCLMIPGINVVQAIILPGVLPGCCALVAIIPLIIVAVKASQAKNAIREQVVEKTIELFEKYGLPERPNKKKRVSFVVENFFKELWATEYKLKLVKDITERLGKDKKTRNPRQNTVAKILESVSKKLNDPNKN